MQDCSELNFPIKSFYSAESKNCHTFYRQGHGFTAKAEQPDQCKQERLTTADFGSMYLIYDKALVVRSSNSILFFKIDEDKNSAHFGEWTEYAKLPKIRGEIYYIKRNVRI